MKATLIGPLRLLGGVAVLMLCSALVIATVFGLAFLLVSCSNDPAPVATNSNRNVITERQQLVAEYKTAEVFAEPDDGYRFIVRDTNGAVWFIQSGRVSPRESGKTVIFGPTVPAALKLEDDAAPNNLHTNQ